MWIIPKNHSLHSAFATDLVDSTEDWNEELQHYGTHTKEKKGINLELSNMPLFWKSSPLPPTIWQRKWSRVWWLQRLSGLILKHSRTKAFTEKYTSSLEDILASHFHKPGYRTESMIHDISSLSLNMESTQLDLFSASSKMSPTTSTSDTKKFDGEYQALVTKLKRTYSLRSKWAHHILENVFSSSPWPTPTALNRVRDEETLQKCLEYRKNKANQNTVPLYLEETVNKWATPITSNGGSNNNSKAVKEDGHGTNLKGAVENWTTPLASSPNRKTKFQQGGTPLPVQVQQWTTPSSRDWKDTQGMEMQRKDGRTRLDQLPRQVFFQQDKEDTSTNGKNLVLNPGWVLQLMGTTLQKTFFAWQEMPLLSSRPSSPSEP